MNEINSSLFLLVSEIGLILLLVLGTILFLAKKRSMKDKTLVMALVEKIKSAEPDKREKLLTLLKETYGYDDKKAEEKIDEVIRSEKNLYNNLIQIFLKNNRNKISGFDRYLNDIIESYQGMSSVEDNANTGNEEGQDSNLAITREENNKLRDTNKKLKHDLNAAMDTMESMMSEYASMYEGGQKDGEQRMKNEMFKLRQVLESTSEDDENNDEVENLDISIEEINLDEDEESEK